MHETARVVNPRYRELDGQNRSRRAKLSRKKAEYGALIYKGEIEEKRIKQYVQKKSELQEGIETLERKIETLKHKRKETTRHISFAELPETEQFKSLKKSGKQFSDVIKMIAYRAETAMANILRDDMLKKDEARALVRQIFMTDADIENQNSQYDKSEE